MGEFTIYLQKKKKTLFTITLFLNLELTNMFLDINKPNLLNE